MTCAACSVSTSSASVHAGPSVAGRNDDWDELSRRSELHGITSSPGGHTCPMTWVPALPTAGAALRTSSKPPLFSPLKRAIHRYPLTGPHNSVKGIWGDAHLRTWQWTAATPLDPQLYSRALEAGPNSNWSPVSPLPSSDDFYEVACSSAAQPVEDQPDTQQPCCSTPVLEGASSPGEPSTDPVTPTDTRPLEPQAAAQIAPEDVEDEPLLSSSEERFVMYPVRQDS